jgi:hypothetical protein
MKIIWIIFVALCILLFTFLFVRIRNPITNIELYYHDATISRDLDIVQKLQDSYRFYNFYVIYIIKCLTEPAPHKSYTMTTYVTKFDDFYLVVLCSRRYVLNTLTGNSHVMTLRFSDHIINIPYISTIWSYHKFNITLTKNAACDEGDIVVCGRNTNGPTFPAKLKVSEFYNVKIYDAPMKFYILNFGTSIA